MGLLLPYLAYPRRDRVAKDLNFCFAYFSTLFRLSNFRVVFVVCSSVLCTNQEVYILDSAVTHKSMCTVSSFNCLILNCVYSLQFESPAPFVFCYPPSASLVVPFAVPSLPCLSSGLLLVLTPWGGQLSSGLGFSHPFQIGDLNSGCFQIRCLEDMALIQL